MAIEMIDRVEHRLDGIISCEGWTHHSVSPNAFKGYENETLNDERLARRTHYGTIARTHWSEEELDSCKKIWKKWKKRWVLLERIQVPVLEIWGG